MDQFLIFVAGCFVVGVLAMACYQATRPIWYPVSYRNYNDTSYTKGKSKGQPSHILYYVDLRSGRSGKEIFFMGGYYDDQRLKLAQEIVAARHPDLMGKTPA